MVMPDDESITKTNLIGLAFILFVCFLTAFVLVSLGAAPLDIISASILLAAFFLFTVRVVYKPLTENVTFNTLSSNFFWAAPMVALFLLSFSALYLHPPLAFNNLRFSSNSIAPFSIPVCLNASTQGAWGNKNCPSTSTTTSLSGKKAAKCELNKWEWEDTKCPLMKIETSRAKLIFQHKTVTFIGIKHII